MLHAMNKWRKVFLLGILWVQRGFETILTEYKRSNGNTPLTFYSNNKRCHEVQNAFTFHHFNCITIRVSHICYIVDLCFFALKYQIQWQWHKTWVIWKRDVAPIFITFFLVDLRKNIRIWFVLCLLHFRCWKIQKK